MYLRIKFVSIIDTLRCRNTTAPPRPVLIGMLRELPLIRQHRIQPCQAVLRLQRSEKRLFRYRADILILTAPTHVKVCANNNKHWQKVVREEALFYEEQLKKEIDEDRIAHGEKPLKDKADIDLSHSPERYF